MNVTIMKLLAILDEETACYRAMQNILAEEEASITLSGKDGFDQVQIGKESLLIKIQHYEKVRKNLVDQLADAYQVDEPAMTVSKLARYIAAPDKEKLLQRAKCLRSCMADVKLKNNHNRQLIRQYLELINGSLKLLNRVIYDNSVYRRPGTGHSATGYQSSGGRFFCKSV